VSEDLDKIDVGLGQMGVGMRRAHAAFAEADEGFLQILEGLKIVTIARGTLDERFEDLRETIARLEALVLAQGEALVTLRKELGR